jgi:hypothetical protein
MRIQRQDKELSIPKDSSLTYVLLFDFKKPLSTCKDSLETMRELWGVDPSCFSLSVIINLNNRKDQQSQRCGGKT